LYAEHPKRRFDESPPSESDPQSKAHWGGILFDEELAMLKAWISEHASWGLDPHARAISPTAPSPPWPCSRFKHAMIVGSAFERSCAASNDSASHVDADLRVRRLFPAPATLFDHLVGAQL